MLQTLADKFAYAELPHILEVSDILGRNTEGKVWMLGGGIFRQLANKHWSMKLPYNDLDFVVERLKDDIFLPDGWTAQKNSYGTYKLHKGSFTMDLWSYAQQHSITSRGLDFSIEKVLEFSPLTIQSIAFDISGRKVIGQTGLQAILDRTVRVNNQEQAEHYCKLKGFTVEQFVHQKARALNFMPIFS